MSVSEHRLLSSSSRTPTVPKGSRISEAPELTMFSPFSRQTMTAQVLGGLKGRLIRLVGMFVIIGSSELMGRQVVVGPVRRSGLSGRLGVIVWLAVGGTLGLMERLGLVRRLELVVRLGLVGRLGQAGRSTCC